MRIGDIANGSGLSAEIIRYLERLGLISPPGRLPSGDRCHNEHSLERPHFTRR
ncbi:MerR family DNA-binding transcriptional regulator [Marinobacterium rhizophilum]|uniref:MerR family DNA-binding transcriptional regulator n=1 Tax=Marinobacterium rhizophilum TaxID=420402 RepID=UPI000A021914